MATMGRHPRDASQAKRTTEEGTGAGFKVPRYRSLLVPARLQGAALPLIRIVARLQGAVLPLLQR